MARKKIARKAKHDDSGRVIVTTSRGRRVECLPTQMVIDQVRELYSDMKPDPPEYTVTDVSGAQEVRRYTETTITGPNVSDEDKQKWVEYLAEVARIDREYNDHVLRVVAVECIKILDMPPEEEWVKRDKWIYGENVISDDPDERLYHYFKTKIIGTQQDGYDIMLGIHRASGVDEEVLASLEASFRSEVEDTDGNDAEPNEGDTASSEQ
jgi:hypothetical protein